MVGQRDLAVDTPAWCEITFQLHAEPGAELLGVGKRTPDTCLGCAQNDLFFDAVGGVMQLHGCILLRPRWKCNRSIAYPSVGAIGPYKGWITPASILTPRRISPSVIMSARSTPRCTSPATTPGRVSRSRCTHGSQRRCPNARTGPMLNSRPTNALRSTPRVTRFRRDSPAASWEPSASVSWSSTSDSMSVTSYPRSRGDRGVKVPAVVAYRSPKSPLPLTAVAAARAFIGPVLTSLTWMPTTLPTVRAEFAAGCAKGWKGTRRSPSRKRSSATDLPTRAGAAGLAMTADGVPNSRTATRSPPSCGESTTP